MDLIIEGYMRRFREDHSLDSLTEDQLFETFAAAALGLQRTVIGRI